MQDDYDGWEGPGGVSWVSGFGVVEWDAVLGGGRFTLQI